MKAAGRMAEHDDYIMPNSFDELKKKAFDSLGS
jgi:hypothetical protein